MFGQENVSVQLNCLTYIAAQICFIQISAAITENLIFALANIARIAADATNDVSRPTVLESDIIMKQYMQ